MENYLNKLTVVELRKRYKIISRYRMKKYELIEKIMEQQEEIPNYEAFKNVFKNLPVITLLDYYKNPPFAYFKTLANDEFYERVDFTQLTNEEYSKLTEDIILEFRYELCWKKLSQYTVLSSAFIKQHRYLLDWHHKT